MPDWVIGVIGGILLIFVGIGKTFVLEGENQAKARAVEVAEDELKVEYQRTILQQVAALQVQNVALGAKYDAIMAEHQKLISEHISAKRDLEATVSEVAHLRKENAQLKQEKDDLARQVNLQALEIDDLKKRLTIYEAKGTA